jgi:hypothetical protein
MSKRHASRCGCAAISSVPQWQPLHTCDVAAARPWPWPCVPGLNVRETGLPSIKDEAGLVAANPPGKHDRRRVGIDRAMSLITSPTTVRGSSRSWERISASHYHRTPELECSAPPGIRPKSACRSGDSVELLKGGGYMCISMGPVVAGADAVDILWWGMSF